MNCTTADTLIQAGVDGRLTLTERQALDAHLASCAACRHSWDAQRRLAQLADQWARPTAADDPGDAFTAAILAQISTRPETAPRQLLSHVWLPLAALLCLSVAAAFLPGLSRPDLSALALSAQQLPHWLLSNLHSIPDAAQLLMRVPMGFTIPRYAWLMLLLIIALNSVFCVHARRQMPQRSLS